MNRRPPKPFPPIVEKRIRAEFEAREGAGGRLPKRHAETSEPPRHRRPTIRLPDAVAQELIS